jgi:radical SAM protein with 4Fe4S-binding SPASM domain
MIDLASSLGITELNCFAISLPARYNRPDYSASLKGLPPDFNLKNELVDFTDESVARTLRQAADYAAKKGVLLTALGLLGRKGVAGRLDVVQYALKKARGFPLPALMNLGLAYVRNFLSLRGAWCSFPWRQMVLTARGEVLPCCVWDEKQSMGNISSASLTATWNAEPFRRLRQQLAKNNPPPLCQSCTRVRSKLRHGV